MASSPSNTPTIAIGVGLGSYNARIAMYDENLEHPVVCANHDGHRETRVVTETSAPVTVETLEHFYLERLLKLASDSAHTKELCIVTSIPNQANDAENGIPVPDDWLEILSTFGSVISEAAAVCLANELDGASEKDNRVLVVDGGASGLKATILKCNSSGLWVQEHHAKLDSVSGSALIEPLAQSVAQQFEQKHRFPRGEVWESKKARAKLLKECEASLSTFQRKNNVAIHVDGLYEGMDCNVTISKPKWEHLSSKLANQVKTFVQGLACLENPEKAVGKVLLSGNLHDWMQPIVKRVVGDKLYSKSGLDPSEAVAIGCSLQAYWSLQKQQQAQDTTDDASTPPMMQVPVSPVAIGVKSPSSDEIALISQGVALPCMVTHEYAEAVPSVELWQLEPTKKAIAKLEDVEKDSTLTMQLSTEGRLRIWINGESLTIG